MKRDTYELPPIARELIRIVGLQATMTLVRQFAGQQLYIPHPDNLDDDNKLARTIGLDLAAVLAQKMPATRLNVPFCPGLMRAARDREIWAAYMAGESCFAIAQRYRLCWRSVQRITMQIRMRGGPPEILPGIAERSAAKGQLEFAWMKTD